MGHYCKCGEYVFLPGGSGHKCPPVFFVWNDTYGPDDDGARVHAHDHESAAEKWAEHDDFDSAEYSIVGGSPATVRVRPETNAADEKWFKVRGEAEPQYYADEIDKPGTQKDSLT